jgi:hypothetical protein
MNGVLAFNLAMLLVCAAIAAGVVPSKLYDGLMRGLHNTIGITTPTPRQARWVMIVWIVSTVIIVDIMAALLVYVF